MTTLLEKINDLNGMDLQGKAMEASEKYYHEDVVMHENENEPTEGKAANRKHEEAFFASITDLRKAKPLKVTVGENITMVEWHYNYTSGVRGVRNYTQVSVQKWKDGQIIKEKFYYGS